MGHTRSDVLLKLEIIDRLCVANSSCVGLGNTSIAISMAQSEKSVERVRQTLQV